MRITNLNCADDIGATAWMVEMEGHRILLDCGCHPKRDGHESLPLLDSFKGQEVDAIAISHCHHDHVGALPVAIRHFPQAHVLMTELSYFLVERVLHNSANVMSRQRSEGTLKGLPLYSHDEIDSIAHLFQGYRYNREIEWAAFHKAKSGFRSPTIEFFDAGHALGSAGMMLRGKDETIFFTGDVSFRDQTILKGAQFEDVQADVLIMETTRGNKEVAPGFTRTSEIQRLSDAILEVVKRNGCVLIPVFALGRTQEILAQLALMMHEGKLKRQPIYIGGLGRVFTEIYDLQAHRTHRQLSNMSLTEALNLVVIEKGQLERMKLKGDRIFVLTAGMMTEHTAAHDLALRLAGNERHGIFFVGYTDPQTPGGRLRAAAQGETFEFSPSGGLITKNCEVRDFDLTAHANRDELIDFVAKVNPRKIILGHGEPACKEWFQAELAKKFPKVSIVTPKAGQTIDA